MDYGGGGCSRFGAVGRAEVGCGGVLTSYQQQQLEECEQKGYIMMMMVIEDDIIVTSYCVPPPSSPQGLWAACNDTAGSVVIVNHDDYDDSNQA